MKLLPQLFPLTLLLMCLCYVHSIRQQTPFISPSVLETNPDYANSYGLALEAIFGIGIRLQILLDINPAENFMVSPISAASVIGQLMLGADGVFRDQLYELLSLPHVHKNDRIVLYGKNNNNSSIAFPYSTFHLQLSSLLKALQSGKTAIARQFILKQKNAVFLGKQIQLKEHFRNNLRAYYDSDLFRTDFRDDSIGSQRLINAWASNHTNGLIQSLLSSPPSPGTSSIFANAIYFLGEWETPFSDILNRKGLFTVSPNKNVNVTYMIGIMEDILYVESDSYRMISLPYKNNELSMYIMLPNEGSGYEYNLKEFSKSLKIKELLNSVSHARRHQVTIKIPKMSLTSTVSILEPLQKYTDYKKQTNINNNDNVIKLSNKFSVLDKLEDAVEDFSNFTKDHQSQTGSSIYLNNAAINASLEVTKIVQQMIFAINEKGTEAAAVTAGIIDYIGGSKVFLIDRPFLFFIRHDATSVVLFWGAVNNPAT